MKNKTEGLDLNKKIGFFDVDSRQLAAGGLGLDFQDRVLPVADKLNRLYDFAYKYQLTFVFTACCSGAPLQKDSLDYVVYVPSDKNDDSWIKKMANRRYFYLQKNHYGNPRINFECVAYDTFKTNGNAKKLFELLGIKRWAVFGNGFDLCVYHICLNLLELGFEVVIIDDVTVPAYGTGKIGTEENKKAILRELIQKGAAVMKLEEFLKTGGFPEKVYT